MATHVDDLNTAIDPNDVSEEDFLGFHPQTILRDLGNRQAFGLPML